MLSVQTNSVCTRKRLTLDVDIIDEGVNQLYVGTRIVSSPEDPFQGHGEGRKKEGEHEQWSGSKM